MQQIGKIDGIGSNQRRRLDTELGWVYRIDPTSSLLSPQLYAFSKRSLDIALVLAASPVWFLAVVLCAALIKLDSPREPVFFLQLRSGKGGRQFMMFKFRTMVSTGQNGRHGEAVRARPGWFPDRALAAMIRHDHGRKHVETGKALAGTGNDNRVTAVGRVLRMLYLDELPQLLNVLKGDMSLVGPRPTSFTVAAYDLWHTERVEVMPGLTGLWQILQRKATGFDDRFRLDILYARRRCLWLDLGVLLRTPTTVLAFLGNTHRPERG